METSLKDWIKSITYDKNDIVKNNPDAVFSYKPFIVNKILGGFSDCVLLVNEMNINNTLDNDMQYSFLINTIRKKKRFSPWINKDKVDYLDDVKQYYNYSTEKALEALKILTKDELININKQLDTGGMK